MKPVAYHRLAANELSVEARHKKVSFQEELRSLRREHQLEFDERYVWDWAGPNGVLARGRRGLAAAALRLTESWPSAPS
ncbi:MAG: hypothetical protein ABSH34_15495 [Verrucomicrobiota bacterium]|jgi:hypothetical protein